MTLRKDVTAGHGLDLSSAHLPVHTLPSRQRVGVHQSREVEREDGQAAQRAAVEA